MRRFGGFGEDPLDDLGELASNLDGDAFSGFVLSYMQGTIGDIGTGHFQHVSGALPGQQGLQPADSTGCPELARLY